MELTLAMNDLFQDLNNDVAGFDGCIALGPIVFWGSLKMSDYAFARLLLSFNKDFNLKRFIAVIH